MKKNLQKLFFFIAFISGVYLNAQNVGINENGAAPSGDALLDIATASGTKGLLIPRVNIANLATIAPITGGTTTSLLVYNTNAGTGLGFYYWDGSAWVMLSTGAKEWQILGNSNTTAGTNFLGTTNAQALNFRTSNLTRFTIPTAYQVWAENNGSAALPFYSRSADPNTGMYFIGADILGFTTAGLERFRMGTTETVFNELSYNYDLRIEGNGQANLFFTDAGNDRIGIRTATPSWMFHMTNGGATVGAGVVMAGFDNSDGNGVALSSYNISTANVYNGFEGVTNGTYSGCAGLALTNGAGGIGIYGSTNDWQNYGVYGSRFNSGGANTGFGGVFVNDLGYTGWFGNVSDKRLKKDIISIDNALNIVSKLRPVKYHFDIEKYPLMGLNTELEYGFIAQEVNEVLPEIIREKLFPINGAAKLEAHSENKRIDQLFYAMDYTRLIPISIKAIQEQQLMIEAQNKRIEELERVIKELLENK